MTNGEPDTSRGVRPVREGVSPRPLAKASMARRCLPYAVSVLSPQEAAQAKAFGQQFMEIVDAADMDPDMSEAS